MSTKPTPCLSFLRVIAVFGSDNPAVPLGALKGSYCWDHPGAAVPPTNEWAYELGGES